MGKDFELLNFHYCYLCKINLLVLGMNYIGSSYLLRGAHWKPQTTQPITKATGCSPHTEGKAQIMKKTHTQFIQYGEVDQDPPRAFTSRTSIHGPGRYSAVYQRRKMNTNHAANLHSAYNCDHLQGVLVRQ